MPRKSRQNDAGAILALFIAMVDEASSEDEAAEEIAKFIEHARIEIWDANNWTQDVLRHYRTPLGYDVCRLAHDYSTFPPIAKRIWELQEQKAHELAAQDAARKRAKANGGALAR